MKKKHQKLLQRGRQDSSKKAKGQARTSTKKQGLSGRQQPKKPHNADAKTGESPKSDKRSEKGLWGETLGGREPVRKTRLYGKALFHMGM